LDTGGQLALDLVDLPPVSGPLPLEMADELACVGAWLDRSATRVHLLRVDGELSSPWPGLPSFRPVEPRPAPPPAAPASVVDAPAGLPGDGATAPSEGAAAPA